MKRHAIKRRPMADSVLKNLEPESKPYREHHIDNIYLQVTPNGGKSWLLRFKNINNKLGWLGLGPLTNTTSTQARIKAAHARQQVANGINPVAAKKQAITSANPKNPHLFKNFAKEWLKTKVNVKSGAKAWSASTADKFSLYLDKDIIPALGNKLVMDITPKDCSELLNEIEERGAFNIAKKVRQWLGQIFAYAQGKGLITLDPSAHLVKAAASAPASKEYAHLTEAELPKFLCALKNTQSKTHATTKIATLLLLLTAVRPGNIRQAEWAEFNLKSKTWEIPAAKTKMRRDHVVPLPTQAIKLLGELRLVTGHSKYLFPSNGGYGKRNEPHISESTILNLIKGCGYKGKMTGHGSRHTAATLLNEHNWDSKYIDAQLGHLNKSATSKQHGTYNKAIYLGERRKMMQWYANHLEKLATPKDK